MFPYFLGGLRRGGHRPTYSTDQGDATNGQRIRFLATVEPLFIKYGVDLYLGAHNHGYERTCQVANYVCTPGNDRKGPRVCVCVWEGCWCRVD